MATHFYYVYALKDPRSSPARPFYIGKGTGSRAYDHLVRPDGTRKYARINEIVDSGAQPLVDVLVEDLTEAQALRLEAELISAFGTEETGGLLTNAVVPTGLGGKKRKHVVVPQGAVERAQLGLEFLKQPYSISLWPIQRVSPTQRLPASWAFAAIIEGDRKTISRTACWICC